VLAVDQRSRTREQKITSGRSSTPGRLCGSVLPHRRHGGRQPTTRCFIKNGTLFLSLTGQSSGDQFTWNFYQL